MFNRSLERKLGKFGCVAVVAAFLISACSDEGGAKPGSGGGGGGTHSSGGSDGTAFPTTDFSTGEFAQISRQWPIGKWQSEFEVLVPYLCRDTGLSGDIVRATLSIQAGTGEEFVVSPASAGSQNRHCGQWKGWFTDDTNRTLLLSSEPCTRTSPYDSTLHTVRYKEVALHLTGRSGLSVLFSAKGEVESPTGKICPFTTHGRPFQRGSGAIGEPYTITNRPIEPPLDTSINVIEKNLSPIQTELAGDRTQMTQEMESSVESGLPDGIILSGKAILTARSPLSGDNVPEATLFQSLQNQSQTHKCFKMPSFKGFFNSAGLPVSVEANGGAVVLLPTAENGACLAPGNKAWIVQTFKKAVFSSDNNVVFAFAAEPKIKNRDGFVNRAVPFAIRQDFFSGIEVDVAVSFRVYGLGPAVAYGAALYFNDIGTPLFVHYPSAQFPPESFDTDPEFAQMRTLSFTDPYYWGVPARVEVYGTAIY